MTEALDGLEELVDESGSTCGYYCKGHVTPDAFLAEIYKFELDEYGKDADRMTATDLVEHIYARKVPLLPHERDHAAYSYRFEPSQPGRGAFKATHLSLL